MTQEEAIQYNKRCAEFLGWKETSEEFKIAWVGCKTKERLEKINKDYIPILEKDGDIRFPDFSGFTEDWNWIMEVVEKILDIALEIDSMEMYYNITDAIPDINATTLSINQFLIWHEQNK